MKTKLAYFLLLVGTGLFYYLFWHESHGVNILVYSIFMLFAIKLIGKGGVSSKLGIVFSVTLLSTASAIAWHGSLFAIVMYYFSFVLLIGWLHGKQLTTVLYAFASSFAGLFKIPAEVYRKLPIKKASKRKVKLFVKVLKLSFLPIVVVLVFYFIYLKANPVFENYTINLFAWLNDAFLMFFKNISFAKIMFVLLGFFLTAWFIFITNQQKLHDSESKNNENLIRKRIKRLLPNKDYVLKLKERSPVLYRERFALSLKLKNEYISALVLFLLVNCLLLVVNTIDIYWVWFGFSYSGEINLSQFVHEATYLLIISIFLSMGIMLFFFRRNLNFYVKSKSIKILAYCWIIQNFVLALSVAIRNYHYVNYYDLTGKRIGVLIFLAIVCFGLYTLFVKIKSKKTAYFLLKKNSLAVYLILVSASLINWEGLIAEHNLGQPEEKVIDVSYLLKFSDRILPMIDAKPKILEQNQANSSHTYFGPYSSKDFYKLRVELFIGRYEKESWASWNYSDWKAYHYFKNK